ncbi:MAG: pectin esterase, partial [Bacteroidales bacterium]|nr:pectin esterase [Bacteroidales bacterium]
AFYAEYKNFGPGADISKRVGWSRQLTDEQAAEYTRENILRGWNPIK